MSIAEVAMLKRMILWLLCICFELLLSGAIGLAWIGLITIASICCLLLGYICARSLPWSGGFCLLLLCPEMVLLCCTCCWWCCIWSCVGMYLLLLLSGELNLLLLLLCVFCECTAELMPRLLNYDAWCSFGCYYLHLC